MNLEDLFFDTPYWILIFMGLVGVALLVLGNQRQNKSLLSAGGAALGVVVLLVLLSHFVETGKKQVNKRTTQLVNAVVAADATAMRRVLDPKADAYGMDTNAIIQAACAAATASMVKDVTITRRDVTQDASGIISHFDCIAQFKPESTIPVSAVPTSWELRWAKSPDRGWLIYDITCTKMGSESGDTVKNYILSYRILVGSPSPDKP